MKIFAVYFLSLTLVGAGSFAKGVSAEETIKKAQAKFLEENRAAATSLLVQAMKGEKKDSTAFRKLSKALVQISETFVSEKAQQLFELSRSLKQSDPQASLEKLKNANEIEPDNETVLRGMTALLLQSGDCDKARDLAMQTLAKNPFSDVMVIYKIQSSMCLKNMETLRGDLADGMAYPIETHKQLLSAEIELGQAVIQKFEGKPEAALKYLEKAQSLDERLTETRWMTHLIFVEMKKPDLTPLREYVEICAAEKTTKVKDADLYPRSCVDHKLAKEELELRGKQ